jgi:hypothetical protein
MHALELAETLVPTLCGIDVEDEQPAQRPRDDAEVHVGVVLPPAPDLRRVGGRVRLPAFRPRMLTGMRAPVAGSACAAAVVGSIEREDATPTTRVGEGVLEHRHRSGLGGACRRTHSCCGTQRSHRPQRAQYSPKCSAWFCASRQRKVVRRCTQACAKGNVYCCPAGRGASWLRIMPPSSVVRRVAVGCARSRARWRPGESRPARHGRAHGARWTRRAPAPPPAEAPRAAASSRSGGAQVVRVVRGVASLGTAMRPLARTRSGDGAGGRGSLLQFIFVTRSRRGGPDGNRVARGQEP